MRRRQFGLPTVPLPSSLRPPGSGCLTLRNARPDARRVRIPPCRCAPIDAVPWRRDTARAMSQENVEVARRALDAFNRRDLGDRALAAVRAHGLSRGSHAPVDTTLWMVGEFRHEKFIAGGARTRVRPRPSKPPRRRSKTLTLTPEPAGYCAGDVAGERGDRA